ncbi:phage antirepressor KilAC domain-containing protein [Lentzea sp. NPDC034063]|uniref:phage antirepressor KilAC domain-containing protein n=1 Tax=unclassified Lentzea TaxID=2643253 RepID=UPI0033D71E16
MNAALVVQEFCRNEADCVRWVLIDGKPWFVASDVTAALGYANGRRAVEQHVPAHHRNSVPFRDGIRGNPHRSVISEAGLYRLIMRSNTADAEDFQEWVTSVVLPSIRRDGTFSVGHAALAMPPDYPAALRELAATVEREAATKAALESRTLELEAARPAVEFHDQFVQADGLYKVADVAKTLGIPGLGQNVLFKFLRSQRVLIQGGQSHNTPYQPHVNLGRFVVKVTTYQRHGRTVSSKTPYVTPKGLEYIARLVERHWDDR